VVERYAYDPYGRPIYLTASGALSTTQSSSVNNTILYTGRRLDTETGLYYFRARYQDPVLGRFLSRDPIGYYNGASLYISLPLNYLDPTGLRYTATFKDRPIADIINDYQAGAITNFFDDPLSGEDVINQFTLSPCPRCYCASVESAMEFNIRVEVELPQNGIGTYFTLRGWREVKEHERRREDVYRRGYDAFLGPASNQNAKRCGVVCSRTPGLAAFSLWLYLMNLRAAAERDFNRYVVQEQNLIDVENIPSNQRDENDLPLLDPNSTGMFDHFKRTHTVGPPGPATLPNCPTLSCSS